MKRCALLFVLMLALYAAALASPYEYKVSGINLDTNERVVGFIIDEGQNGTLTGTIWDRIDVFPVSGHWAGKGLMELYGKLYIYSVEVVE